MHVFLLIIIPLVYLTNELLCRNRKIGLDHVFCIIAGLIIACVYTLIDFFAAGSSHGWINNMASVWSQYLFGDILLPLVVCAIPVMLAKDSMQAKVQYLFPVLSAFYAVFIPYQILSEGMAPDGFMMICYPLMMAAMLFNIDTASSVFAVDEDISRLLWMRCLIAGFAVLAGILLPPLFAAAYFLNRAGVAVWIFMILFILLAPGIRFAAKFFLKTKNAE